jgi:transposase
MPKSTFVPIPPEEYMQMLVALRRARYGYLLALPILLLCAAGRKPTTIAAVLFCSRSSVCRTVRAYRAGTLYLEHDDQGRLVPPVRTTVLVPMLRRSLVGLLKAPPRAYGWCRTRWSGATLALTLQTKRGIMVSAETMRRWVHEVGWVWKRTILVAKDDDPYRVERLACIRFVDEQLRLCEALGCADELDMHLLPKVGYAWRPQGSQLEVMTPGTTAAHNLAGALDVATGTRHYGQGPRQTHGLFRDWLQTLEAAYPAAPYQRIDVVVDHSRSIRRRPSTSGWRTIHA